VYSIRWSLAESDRRSLGCATRTVVCDKRPHSVVDIIKQGDYRRLKRFIRWSNITCRIVRNVRAISTRLSAEKKRIDYRSCKNLNGVIHYFRV